jgi:hypothetical protein
MEEGTHLQVEAHDGFRPALPHLAGVCAFVVQNVGKAIVVGSEGVLRLVKVPSAPTIVVNVPEFG